MSLNRIFPECFTDTALVSKILQVEYQSHYYSLSLVLGEPVESVGFGGVANGMMKYSHDNVIVGLFDNDFKRSPSFLKAFIIVDDRREAEGLALHHLPGTKKFFIKLYPKAVERWLWDVSGMTDVRKDFPAYTDWKSLAQLKKQYDLGVSPEMGKFIDALIAANPAPVQTLRIWLSMVVNENE